MSRPEQNDESPAELSLDEVLPLAMQLHSSGRLVEARKLYEAFLDRMPDHPDALHFFGVLRHQMGESDEGIALIRRALTLRPDYAAAHNNLGNVLKQTGKLEEAAVAYSSAVELEPGDPDVHNNLGVLLKRLGRSDQALECYEKAIALAPRHVDAHTNLARVLYTLRRFEDAAATWRKILEIDPEHGLAQHMVAALTGGDPPERASDAYVKSTFDEFAHSFDEQLEGLEYHAPQLVTAAVETAAGPPAGDLDVLDAGCGTGLCGPLIRPWARALVGVDLSPGMLDKARQRGGYDELAAAELTGWLSQNENAYDLIISADTFVYFGDLSALLAAVAHALRARGLLVFTVESCGEAAPEAGFRLDQTGRYSHADAYVEATAKSVGLELRSNTPVTLRKEHDRPVHGRVVVMTRV